MTSAQAYRSTLTVTEDVEDMAPSEIVYEDEDSDAERSWTWLLVEAGSVIAFIFFVLGWWSAKTW